MKVLIVHSDVPPDASADELDVLEQAYAVQASLLRLGHDVAKLPFTLNFDTFKASVAAEKPSLIFSLIESVLGKVQFTHHGAGFLDMLGLPYTGCSSAALSTTTDKILTKRLLVSAGLPTPAWVLAGDAASERNFVPGRAYIIKSLYEEASDGIDDKSVGAFSSIEDLRVALASRAGTFAEEYIPGREFNISVIIGPQGPEILPFAEILFVDYPAGKPRIVGYDAKWQEDSFEFKHTRRTFQARPGDAPLQQKLKEICLACWQLFGLSGYARVDLRVDEEGHPQVLEINANPCISPGAGLPAAAAQAGMSYDELISGIVSAASI